MVCLEHIWQRSTEGRVGFFAGMCEHKLNLTAKIRAAICPRLVHEIMSFVTRPRSQPMSVFVANEYLELTQLRLKLRKPNGDISF